LTGNIVFHTLSGELIVDISSKDGVMLMDFPADTLGPVSTQAIEESVAQAIGVPKDKVVNVEGAKHCQYLVIQVDHSIDVESLEVDSLALVFLASTQLTIG
jgi:predicted PhzF superfamily epimerase YddE/YHI9